MAKDKRKLTDIVEALDNLTLEKKLLDLLKKVLDGDEKAKEQLRIIIDLAEKLNSTGKERYGDSSSLPTKTHNQEDAGDYDDDDDDDDYDDIFYKGPTTFHRNNVRELHLRIKLNGTDFKIWRELKVPSNICLEALAEVLLDVMGWEREHLYQFAIGNDIYETHYAYEEMKEEFGLGWGRHVRHDMSKLTLGDLNLEKSERIRFEYDLGDSWHHDVWIKGEREYKKGERPAIVCVKGQGACPPEDCGGIWGYSELIELTQKKRLTKDEKEQLEWYGMLDGFDPERFNVDETNEWIEYWNNRL